MKGKKRIMIILLGLFCLYLLWGNYALEVTQYSIYSEKLDPAFHGLRILQISDLHNTQFGQNNQKLFEKLKKLEPDLIVITGDMVDSRRTNVEIAVNFAKEATAIAPCYYAPGNHEARLDSETLNTLYTGLEEAGVTLLLSESVSLGNGLTITGKDTASGAPELPPLPQEVGFHILLSHYPEMLEKYAQAGYDLVFTGHAHGGQIRLPFLGGIFVPGQGLFPEYDAGLFLLDQTQMLISRGLGNSLFPLRIHNRPEILVAELFAVPEE